MTELHRHSDPEGADYRSIRWLRWIPPKWRRPLFFTVIVSTALGSFMAGAFSPFMAWLKKSTQVMERQETTGCVTIEMLQAIGNSVESIETRMDRMAAKLDALRDQARDAQRVGDENRRLLREHEEQAYNRHQEIAETLDKIKNKRR